MHPKWMFVMTKIYNVRCLWGKRSSIFSECDQKCECCIRIIGTWVTTWWSTTLTTFVLIFNLLLSSRYLTWARTCGNVFFIWVFFIFTPFTSATLLFCRPVLIKVCFTFLNCANFILMILSCVTCWCIFKTSIALWKVHKPNVRSIPNNFSDGS